MSIKVSPIFAGSLLAFGVGIQILGAINNIICWNCKRIIKIPIIAHVNWINTHENKNNTNKIWNQS